MKHAFFVTALDLRYHSAGKKRLLCLGKALNEIAGTTDFCSLINGCWPLAELESSSLDLSADNGRGVYRMISFLAQVRKQCNELDGESVVILYPSSYQVFDVLAILFFRLCTRQRLFVDVNEVRPHTFHFRTVRRISPTRRLKALVRYLASSLADPFLKLANGHIYISSAIGAYYAKKNCITVPILCDPSRRGDRPCKSYSEGEVFQIGFAGSVDVDKERMDVFFSGVRRLVSKGFKISVNLYGLMGDPSGLARCLDEYGLTGYFHYRGVFAPDRLSEVLGRENHATILPRGVTKQNAYGFSTKLTDYLEAQLPIITSSVGDIPRYFVDKRNAVVYDPASPEDLADKIVCLIESYNDLAPRLVDGGNYLMDTCLAYHNYSSCLRDFID